MAFKRTPSRKCPVCVALSPEKVAQIDAALEETLNHVRATGEVPKVQDGRIQAVALATSTAPASLQFHLRTCLFSRDVRDQLSVEIRDIVSAISTAKSQYGQEPTVDNATAYQLLVDSLIKLTKQAEGKQDPELHVDFVCSVILAPFVRMMLQTQVEELNVLREKFHEMLPGNDREVRGLLDAALQRVASKMRESTDDGIKKITEFYKVEIDAKQRRRTMETAGMGEERMLQGARP